MISLRDELRKSEPAAEPSRLLAVDWLPSFKLMTDATVLRISHEFVSVRHEPARVARRYLFARPGQNAVALELRLTLCLAGASDAKEVVFRTVESHQGALPRPIAETSASLSLGELGFAWGYREAKTIDAVVFARHNLVVFLRRYGDSAVIECARDLDRDLQACETCDAYGFSQTGAFAEVGAQRPATVKQGERLDLATEPADQKFYYAASAGSVNRDPLDARRRYFHAPGAPQNVTAWAYALRAGMLARREVLQIEVTA